MPQQKLPENGVVSYTATVKPEWLDFNNHMNVAYYTMTFDLALDALHEVIGLTHEYIERERRSTVALEAHITYQQEASLGDELRVDTRVIDSDGKRVHVCQEMYRGDQLLATQETLSISFDTAARRSCMFDQSFAERHQQMVEAQRKALIPSWTGRKVGIRRK